MTEYPLTARFRNRGLRLCSLAASDTLAVPVSFGDPLAEQRATRLAVGLYDFSFMACIDVKGPHSTEFINRLQTRDLRRLAIGQIAYTLILRTDGTVLTDATVWRLDRQSYRLVMGRHSDIAHLRAMAPKSEVRIVNRSRRSAVIAVQGPNSAALLQRCGANELPGYFRFSEILILGRQCVVAGVGYTGETGFELFVDIEDAPELWDNLVAAGHVLGARECGFEAADALRIEAGFILFTRELAVPVTPYEIGHGQRMAFSRRFLGGNVLASISHQRPTRLLAGLVPERRQAPLATTASARRPAEAAHGHATLTSSAYSALFRRCIALGFVHPQDRYPGTRVLLPSGGSARVARLPFYDPARRLRRSPA